MSFHPVHLLLSVCLVLVAVAAWYDLRTGHIPNWITLSGLGLGFGLQSAVHVMVAGDVPLSTVFLRGMLDSLLGVLVCGLVPYLLFRAEAMGGGDVKLLAAVGAIVGPKLGLELELGSFVAMLAYAPARLAYDGRLFSVLGNSVVLFVNPFLQRSKRREVPQEAMTAFRFGPAVFVANCFVLLTHSVFP